jgi:hypothetical protein
MRAITSSGSAQVDSSRAVVTSNAAHSANAAPVRFRKAASRSGKSGSAERRAAACPTQSATPAGTSARRAATPGGSSWSITPCDGAMRRPAGAEDLAGNLEDRDRRGYEIPRPDTILLLRPLCGYAVKRRTSIAYFLTL